jgi:hypothetical protein
MTGRTGQAHPALIDISSEGQRYPGHLSVSDPQIKPQPMRLGAAGWNWRSTDLMPIKTKERLVTQ